MDRSLRPLPAGAKCSRCRQQAVIRMPHHHAIFCNECFLRFFQTAVARAMKKFPIPASTPLLVAVSGGKDSLGLWDALHELGYATRGLHVNLGIDGFSEASSEAVRVFAEERSLQWAEYSLQESFGYTIPEIRKRTRRKLCGVCGFLKRQLLNRLAIREGYSALAVGHNLDDEAGRMLGNIVRHRTQYFEKQYPFLPSTDPRMPAKLKPLYRLEACDILTYCRVKNIIPLAAKCPLSRGATSHAFKDALDQLETRMPGTKRHFLFTYLSQREPPVQASPFNTCRTCGEPAFGEICSVCNLKELVSSGEDKGKVSMEEEM